MTFAERTADPPNAEPYLLYTPKPAYFAPMKVERRPVAGFGCSNARSRQHAGAPPCQGSARRPTNSGKAISLQAGDRCYYQAGAVLLEVVLALVLFVGAATIISSGLSASVNEVDRLRWNIHASNLAATVLAEMEMGLKPVESSGPNDFEPPFEAWTWQATVGPVPDAIGGLNTLQKVEIVVRHKTQPVVFRLTQFLPPVIRLSGAQGSSLDSTNEPVTSPNL